MHLKGLTNLQTLSLEYNKKLTDAGLAQLSGMKHKALTVSKEATTDLGLKHYPRAIEPPTKLLLIDWQITDAGLVHLVGLTNLERLGLPTQITDVGLVHLKGLTNLETLALDHTNITDGGLAHLKALKGLRFLNLENTPITDAGLVHLKSLTNLRMLFLTNTKVTDAGVAKLKQALPNCNVRG